MTFSSSFYGCAATYLNTAPQQVRKDEPKKKEAKVEAVAPSYTGKTFDSYLREKANHNHSDNY